MLGDTRAVIGLDVGMDGPQSPVGRLGACAAGLCRGCHFLLFAARSLGWPRGVVGIEMMTCSSELKTSGLPCDVFTCGSSSAAWHTMARGNGALPSRFFWIVLTTRSCPLTFATSDLYLVRTSRKRYQACRSDASAGTMPRR